MLPRTSAVVRTALRVGLLLLCVSVAADERIVLRDGSSLTGSVESCNEQGCRIDGRRLRRDAIAAVIFDRDAKQDATPKVILRVDEVRLRDGKVIRGAVRLVTGEEVMTVAGDYGRETVSGIFFSPANPEDQPEILADVLITRDGQRRQGTLTLCSQGSCLLDQTSTLRNEVAWIGLGRGDAAPPPSDRNAVHLTSGEVLEKQLISISDDVLTVSARYKREEVAWIHLVPAAEERPPINRLPPAPPAAPVDPPPPPRGSAPPPAPRPGGLGAGDPCSASQPMGGYVELTHSGPDVESIPGCFHRNESRMWFRLVPIPPAFAWPLRWTGIFQAPSVHYRASMGPCRVVQADGTIWVNPGGTARNDVDLQRTAGNGLIWYTPLLGKLAVALGVGSAVATVTRSAGGGALYTGFEFQSFSIDAGGCADRTHAFSFCSNVTPCTETSAAADCVRQPQKYVVFPWEGSDRVNASADPRINTVVRWKFCCGCGEPPEGGMDPMERDAPDDDPCDRIANLERRLAQLRDARAQFARDLMAAQFRQKTVLLEKILSTEGTVTQTLLALISLLSNANSLEGLGDLIGALLDGNSIVEDPSGENIAEAVVGAAGTDLVIDTIGQAGIVDATQQAADYLARTSDAEGAVRKLEQVFERSSALRDKAKTVTGVLGVIVAAKGLYSKGSELGDSLQEYFDAGDDVRTNQDGLRDAENQILDVELELERLKRELEEPCATSSRFNDGPFMFPMRSADAGRPSLVRYPPQMSTPPSASEAAQLTSDLAEVKRLLLEGETQTAKAVPLMLFFASAQARAAASPELIIALAKALRTRTQAANVAFRRAAEIAQRTGEEVRRQNPATLPPTTAAAESSAERSAVR